MSLLVSQVGHRPPEEEEMNWESEGVWKAKMSSHSERSEAIFA